MNMKHFVANNKANLDIYLAINIFSDSCLERKH